MKRVAALDGLRALAALAVALSHSTNTVLTNRIGSLAMDVFFALSGFMVGGLALDAVGEHGWKARFWVRRALRIWPLYFAVCVVLSLTDPWVMPQMAPHHWMLWTFNENIANIIFFSHFHGWPRQASGLLWSIAVEEHWYLLMPLLLGAVVRRDRIPVVFGTVAVCSIAMRYGLDLYWGTDMTYEFTLTRFDALSFGLIGAWIVRNRRDLIPTAGPIAALFWGIVIGGIGTSASGLWRLVLISQTAGALGTAGLCVLLFESQTSAVARILSWRPLAAIGRISYGVYLIAGLVGEAAAFWLPFGLVRFLLVTCVTLPIAWLSYRFLEQPIQRMGADLFPRKALVPNT